MRRKLIYLSINSITSVNKQLNIKLIYFISHSKIIGILI